MTTTHNSLNELDTFLKVENESNFIQEKYSLPGNDTPESTNPYKKFGFWFYLYHDGHKSSYDLLLVHQKKLEIIKEFWRAYYENVLNDLKSRVRLHKHLLGTYKNELQEYELDIEEKRKLLDKIKLELNEVSEEILGLEVLVRQKSIDLTNSFHATLRDRLIEIQDLQKIVVTNEISLNENLNIKNELSNKNQIEQLSELRDVYKNRFTRIRIRIEKMVDNGINDRSSLYLLSFGSICAGVAAWFFSIFTTKTNFGNQDVFYYLFQGFLKVGQNPNYTFLQKILVFVGSLVIIGFVIWVIGLFINHLRNGVKQKGEHNTFVSKIKFNLSDTSTIDFRSSSTWLIGLLQLVPFILVSGIVILVLSSTSNIESQTSDLNNSTGGLLAGAAIVAGLTGLIYLYITLIIESRVDLNSLGSDAINKTPTFKKRWEIIVLIGLFVLSILFLFTSNSDDGKQVAMQGIRNSENLKIYISCIQFLSTAFIAAFSFSYGIRYRGMIATSDFLERKIRKINALLEFYITPSIEIDDNLKQHTAKITSQQFDIVKEKLNDLSSKLQYPSFKTQVTTNKMIPFAKFSFFKPRNYSGNQPASNQIDEIDILIKSLKEQAAAMPDVLSEIIKFESLHKIKKSNLADVEEILNQYENRTGKWKVVDDKIENCKRNIRVYRRLYHKKILQMNLKNIEIEKEGQEQSNALLDGFHLGEWYGHEINPLKNQNKNECYGK